MSPASKIALLKDRASSFQKVRSFFSEKNILEVDTPILSQSAPIDEHIDIMSVDLGNNLCGYLHSSPEYAMKRLLTLGLGDIFQMSHVFRQGEVGALHNPEFTMVEWYRLAISFSDFIEETVDFIRLFLGPLPHKTISYKEAFILFAGLDPFKASSQELLQCTLDHNLSLSSSIPLDKDTLLHLLMGFVVEPHLGINEIVVLTDYPASQAALAKTEMNEGNLVAKRFEIYYQGIELANGYLELTDAALQKERFEESNNKRRLSKKPELPIDYKFLKALSHGMPSCCGVAAGFDRLFMLKHRAKTLEEILPFSWKFI